MAHFSILRPAAPFIFKTVARGDISHPNVADRWIWVWDPCFKTLTKTVIIITLRMFFKCSTEISPLENFLLAYVESVDWSSYITTPRSREIPENHVEIISLVVFYNSMKNHPNLLQHIVACSRIKKEIFKDRI